MGNAVQYSYIIAILSCQRKYPGFHQLIANYHINIIMLALMTKMVKYVSHLPWPPTLHGLLYYNHLRAVRIMSWSPARQAQAKHKANKLYHGFLYLYFATTKPYSRVL